MIEVKGDLWHYDAPVVCITTNGFVKSNGYAVMGRGCAKQAADMWPALPATLGDRLRAYGNHVHWLGNVGSDFVGHLNLVSFPVKPTSSPCKTDKSNVVAHMRKHFQPGQTVPGWACVAELSIIQRSCYELVQLVTTNAFHKVVLPRPGCGAGELNWNDVKPVLQKWLDDRFHVITY